LAYELRRPAVGIEFFQTIMGKTFYEGTVPAIMRELKKLNENLTKMNELKEKELKLKEKPSGEE
jgi:hypothetical protein